MDTFENLKRKAGRIAVIVLALMIVTPILSNFIIPYLTIFSNFAIYVSNFLSMFVIFMLADWATKIWLKVG